MRILDKPCKALDNFTCPWHAWTYNIQGKLVATPAVGGENVHQVEGIDYGKLRLEAVRSDSWMGIIFINPDGAAVTLSEHLAAIQFRLQDYDLSLLRSAGTTKDVHFSGNWKFVVEGGVENYHMPWVHPEGGGHAGVTREDTDPAGGYVGMATRWRRSPPEEGKELLPKFPLLEGAPIIDGYGWEDLYLFISPGTTVIEVMANHVVVVLILPLDCGQTLMRREFFFIGDQAMTEEYAEIHTKIKNFWTYFGEQDKTIVERVHAQQSIRAELNMPTRFSPYWESPVHSFQKLLVNWLQ